MISRINTFYLVTKGQRGQSLIQVLIAMGIMSAMTMVFSTMMSSQQKEVTALSQRMAAMDFKRLLTSSIASGTVCKYLAAPYTFDSTTVSPTTPQYIHLPAGQPMYGSVDPGPPLILGPEIARVGNPVSPYSTAVVVKDISLAITNPPATPGGAYIGTWVIALDPSKLVRPLQNVTADVLINADITNPNAAKVTGCQGAGGTATFAAASCPVGQFMIGINSDGTPKCTTDGSQLGAPCIGGGVKGVTANGPYGSHRCCLIGYQAADIQVGGLFYGGCIPF